MDLINDIIYFCSALSVDDYIFFFAVVLLFVLIISLIYFLKIEESKVPSNELEIITKKIEKEYKPAKIEFSNFEKEQEAEAIISYDELVENNKKYELNYEDEKVVDGLKVQKVDNSDMFHEVENEDFEIEIKKIRN